LSEKLKHELSVDADLDTPYNVGLIIGASGSGKTTLAKRIFGDDCFDFRANPDVPVIDQFDERYSYDECVDALIGIGLTSVPCWLRPVKTMSTGQRHRALAALQMMNSEKAVFAMDEFTSLVDRNVAAVMAHCVQKFARRHNKAIVLCSCHYDVVGWLNPDWVIDCNTQTYTDRRRLRCSFERTDKITIEIRECSHDAWKYFSKYHYLSSRLATGVSKYFGAYIDENQIGFLAFNNYVPWRDKRKPIMMHANRLVVHPDYCGLGIGIKMLNVCASYVRRSVGADVWIKMSSKAMKKSLDNSKAWFLKSAQRDTPNPAKIGRKTGYRKHVKTWSYQFVGDACTC
jgi:ABC-type nitrate/sulfonate/bicarbonate transport system ATPase subunit